MSLNAEAVAREVINTIKAGKLINLSAIQKKHGYSHKSAYAMKAIKTQAYKKHIAPFANLLEKEIQKIQLEMVSRDISVEKYRDLADVLDKLNKNLLLSHGLATENVAIQVQISEAIAQKNGIDATMTKDARKSER